MMQQGGLGNLFSGIGGGGAGASISNNNYSDDDRIGGIQSHLSNLMGEDSCSKIIH